MSRLYDAIDWKKEYVEKVGKEAIEEKLRPLVKETKEASYSDGYRKVMNSIKSRDTGDGYEVDYRCPICKEGIVTYWKEETPGFKCSGFVNCTNCGFSMDKFIDAK